MTRLNHTSLHILGMLLDSRERGESPPTIRSIAESCGRAWYTIQRHLWRLHRLGLVEWEAGHARTLRAMCVFIPANSVMPLEEAS
jgi:predicted transcriptional regulator